MLWLSRNETRTFVAAGRGAGNTAEPILTHPHPLVFGATGGCFSFIAAHRNQLRNVALLAARLSHNKLRRTRVTN